MYNQRRKLYSQNFLHNRKLVTTLVGRSSLTKNDLVLEIGPGKGIITECLLGRAKAVVAVEIDAYWFEYTMSKYGTAPHLQVYNVDFLQFSLPTKSYKVFANLPFSVEGKILRKLLDAESAPNDAYLVVMKEFGMRLLAHQPSSLFSCKYGPWFDFSCEHVFKRRDFTPVPSVDSILLRIKKKTQPLLNWSDRKQYHSFVRLGFGEGQPIKHNLKSQYDLSIIYVVLQKLGISRKAKPSRISLQKWLLLYRELKKIGTDF